MGGPSSACLNGLYRPCLMADKSGSSVTEWLGLGIGGNSGVESEAQLDTSRQRLWPEADSSGQYKAAVESQGSEKTRVSKQRQQPGQQWGPRAEAPVAGSLPGHARARARRPPSPGSQQCGGGVAVADPRPDGSLTNSAPPTPLPRLPEFLAPALRRS